MSENSGEATWSEEDRPTRRRRRFRWWHAVLTLLVLVALGLFVMRVHFLRQFEARVTALEAAGHPVTTEQLDAMYPPLAAGQANAADLLQDAVELYRDSLSSQENKLLPLVGSGEIPGRGRSIPNDVREIMTRFLDENREGLARLHDAARLDTCRYRMEWSFDAEDDPLLGATYRNGGLLCLSALQFFDSGQTELAVEAIASGLRLAEFAGQVPTFSATLTSFHVRDRAASTLQWGLNQTSLTEAQLRRLQDAFSQSGDPEIVTRALACHRCMLLPAFRRLDLYPSGEGLAGPVGAIYEALGLAARDGSMFSDVVESHIDVTRQPLSRWQAEMTRIQSQWEPRLQTSALLAPMAEGGFSGALRLYLWNAATIECTRAALAVERYRVTKGSLPMSLSELAPEFLDDVPLDPYTGRTLRYERLQSGFVVYSVGEDGHDDGGWERPDRSQRTSGQTYDITFGIDR